MGRQMLLVQNLGSSVKPIPFTAGIKPFARLQKRLRNTAEVMSGLLPDRCLYLKGLLLSIGGKKLEGWRKHNAFYQQGSLALQTLSLALLAAIIPPETAANTIRVADVDNPSLQYLMKVLGKKPNAIVGNTMIIGLLAANAGHFNEAERFFKIFLKEDANSASAWSNLGNAHLSLGRPEEASEEFTKAIHLAPEAPVPLLNRALAKEALGVKAASKGDAQAAKEQYLSAIQDCIGATDLDPKEFAAWFNKGNIEMRLANFPDALESYTIAADLAPGISGYRLREAELLFQEGQFNRSNQLMRGVVRKNPNFAEAQAALAAVEWASGETAAAEEHFDIATKIDPRWGSIDFINTSTRWPPALLVAMQRLLVISY